MSGLTLGLPSKGRLQSDAIGWFAARGIEIRCDGADREYAASAHGAEGIEVAMLPAGEMPRELAAGRIHIGVTGEDLIREQLRDHARQVEMIAAMGFGHADLVVAVPSSWVDVETMHDLDEVAHDFRARHGRALRVATKYHHLVRAWFQQHGVAEYRLVDSQGATEAAPKNLAAEAIADITTSGATLRDNHLKALTDGPVLQSQAMLCVSRVAEWSDGQRATLERLKRMLGIDP